MSDYISKDDLYWHFVNKGQKSTRYRLGETWELNAEEIRDVIAELPAADVEEVIRCKDCKHRPFDSEDTQGFGVEFPDEKCPCQCDDGWYNWRPDNEWFCANAERRTVVR